MKYLRVNKGVLEIKKWYGKFAWLVVEHEDRTLIGLPTTCGVPWLADQGAIGTRYVSYIEMPKK
jgi:hypothetical protein